MAVCMFAAMAVPCFAVDTNGAGESNEPEKAQFDKYSLQERIEHYDAIYKMNDDGTLSSFREGKINRDTCLRDENLKIPYVVNIKVGETIKVAFSPDFGFESYKPTMLSVKLIRDSSGGFYDEDENAQRVMGIWECTGIKAGTFASTTIQSTFGNLPGGLIWNITEDGSVLTDTEVSDIMSKALADLEASYSQEENAAASSTETPVIATNEGIVYTVKAGDTLGLISLNTYGNYNYVSALYKANQAVLKKAGGKIYKGLEIIIPHTIANGVSAIAPAAAGEGEKLYTVKPGDTLFKIAQAAYGDGNKYKAIFERNSIRIANINTIYAGHVIVLPNV